MMDPKQEPMMSEEDTKKPTKTTMITLAYDAVKFIDEVKKRPGLYTTDATVDRDERLSLWKEVGAAMFSDWHECNKATAYDRVLQLQTKWRSLRDAYSRELRARRSGVRINKCVYRYFTNLSFLGGFDGDVSDLFTYEETQAANYADTGEDRMDNIDPLTAPRVKKPRKRRPKPPPSEDSVDATEMAVCTLEPSEGETDSDKLFLLSFLPEMRQLPLDVKMWARAQIANTMQEAVASYFNNTMPGRANAIKMQANDSSE